MSDTSILIVWFWL